MSFMSKVFGSKGGKPPNREEAIQKLRETEEMLEKKSSFLEKKCEEELQNARRYGTKNKRMALNALKKKKKYEKQLAQVDATLSNIEFQVEALENSHSNTEIFKTMQYGAKALKAAQDKMTADEVHDMMDDITEQQDVAQEISDALSTPMGFASEIDEDDLLAELEELEQEDLDKEMLNLGPSPASLPEVPSDTPVHAKPKAKETEDDEMAELQAWLN